MSKRYLLLIVVALIAGLVASCAQPAPTATPRPTVAPTKAAGAQPTAAVAEPGGEFMAQLRKDGYIGPPLTTENITIHMLDVKPNELTEAMYDRWIAEFEAAFPNINIEPERIPFGDMAAKIQVIVAGGSPPDLMAADGPYTKAYCFYDILEPLNPYVSAEYLADYVPATLEEQSCDGQVYAWPQQQATLTGYFNRDMFVKAGLDAPPETTDVAKGWTWEKFMEAWKKLTVRAADGSTTIWGLAPATFSSGGPGSNYYMEGVFIRGKGDASAPKDSDEYKTWAAISEDGTDVKGYLDSNGAIEGMKFYQSIIQVEKVSPTAAIPNCFADERAATGFHTGAAGANYMKINPNLPMGVTPMPHYEGRAPFSHGGSNSMAVAKGSKHKPEAMAFALYIYNYKNRVEYAQVTKNLPALLSVFEGTGQYGEYPNTLLREALINVAVPRPGGPGYSHYESVANLAIKDIGLGADVASRLHQAAEQLNGLLTVFK